MKKIYFILPVLLSLATLARAQSLQISLNECKKLALERNASIKNAHLDVQAAFHQKDEVLTEFFPTISAHAFAYYAINPILQVSVDDIVSQSPDAAAIKRILKNYKLESVLDVTYNQFKKGYSTNLMLTQPIFAGGRIATGYKLANLQIKAATLNDSIVQRDILEQTEELYWTVISLQEKQKTVNALALMVDTIFRDAQSAVQAGFASANDLLKIELKRDEIKNAQNTLKTGIRLAKMNLFNNIGYDYSLTTNDQFPCLDNVQLVDAIDTIGSPLNYYVDETQIASEQYETKLLSLAVQAKELERRFALGEVLPQVALGAAYGYSNLMDKNMWNGAAFVSVKIPITDWGKASRKLKRLDIETQKAQNNQELLNKQITLQLQKMWMDVTDAYNNMQLSLTTQRTATALYKEQKAYYAQGLISISDLLQTQTDMRVASEAYIDALIKYKVALEKYIARVHLDN